MRKLPMLLGLILCAFLASARPQGHPVPPGLREVEKRKDSLEPPLMGQRRQADLVQLKKEAEELARLAGSIPAQIEQVAQGQLPKDLTEKLKQIEKLAKRLRAEVSP